MNDEAYQRTANNLPNNEAVKIEIVKGKETLTISNLDKLDEPESLIQLKEQVENLLPHVDLPEVLLDIQAKTGFMDEFTHVNESFARVKDLSTSICAVLMKNACNIGLTPLERRSIPALTRSRLNWVEQNYIRPETRFSGKCTIGRCSNGHSSISKRSAPRSCFGLKDYFCERIIY